MNAEQLAKAKSLGFSDRQIANLTGKTEDQIRALRKQYGLVPSYRLVDTCAAEFEAYTPYYYSTYDRGDDEVRRSERRKVMSLGGGPIQVIRNYTRAMARELSVIGLMIVQYAVKGNTVYVLEVSPRASRTVPFVSKAIGVPLAKTGKVAMDANLAALGPGGAAIGARVDRVCEIFALGNNHLPTTAILVPTPGDVDSLKATLLPLLRANALELDVSQGGQNLGDSARVRIFPVEHIKGLEFEAVFYVGLDRMAEVHKNLIDKYVYVGLSRARNFLGVTFERQFPTRLECIKQHFEHGGSWSQCPSEDEKHAAEG
jgi:hypothetical protein